MLKDKKKNFLQTELSLLKKKHDAAGMIESTYAIRIDRQGRWYHEEQEIKRQALVKLLSSVLVRLDNGEFWLITPAEQGRIEVDDAPFIISHAHIEGTGKNQRIELRTSLDDRVILNQHRQVRVTNNNNTDHGVRPYVNVRGKLDALICHSVYYELAALAEEDENNRYGIWSEGYFIFLDADNKEEGLRT